MLRSRSRFIHGGGLLMRTTTTTTLFSLLCMMVVTVSLASAQCTLCKDGSTPQGDFGDLGTCATYESKLSSFASDSKTCRDAQLQGYLHCSCPSYPEEAYCLMCNNNNVSTSLATPRKPFPVRLDGTCEDHMFASADKPEQCDEVAQAGYFCGCPGAVRSDCYLCTQSSQPQSAAIDRVPADYASRLMPPTFEFTCQEWDDASSLFASNECDRLTETLPIDAAAYCGCPLDLKAVAMDTPLVETCSLCPAEYPLVEDADTRLVVEDANVEPSGVGDGEEVQETGGEQRTRARRLKKTNAALYPSTMTCQHLHTVLLFATDADYCASVQQDVGATCCEGYVAPPIQEDNGSTDPGSRDPNSNTSSSRRAVGMGLWWLLLWSAVAAAATVASL